MSEISIIANTKNYNLVKEVSFEEIKIHGDLTATENNFISFHKNNKIYEFMLQ
jgi:hypothetical protein